MSHLKLDQYLYTEFTHVPSYLKQTNIIQSDKYTVPCYISQNNLKNVRPTARILLYHLNYTSYNTLIQRFKKPNDE